MKYLLATALVLAGLAAANTCPCVSLDLNNVADEPN